jgi:hypothetical protein
MTAEIAAVNQLTVTGAGGSFAEIIHRSLD